MDNMTTFQIVSTILSIATILGLGTVTTMFWKDLHTKKEKEIKERSEEHKAAKRQERLNDISEVLDPLAKKIDARFDKVDEKINDIDSSVQIEKISTVVNIRVTLKALRDKYEKNGYCEESDKSTWNELYNVYKNMGGNHFKEYVDQWKLFIEKLPTEKPVKTKTKRSK